MKRKMLAISRQLLSFICNNTISKVLNKNCSHLEWQRVCLIRCGGRYMKLPIILSLFISLIYTSESLSSQCTNFNLYTVGYSALSRVNDDFILETTSALSEEEIIAKILRKINQYSHTPMLARSKESLAQEIYLAARAWKVDPFMFAGLVEKETVFGRDIYNNSGGDSGYTQMTSAGLEELEDQYSSGRLKNMLENGASRYFQNLSSSDFISWISNSSISSSNKRRLLREDTSLGLAYGLAAGASLLRVYLSVNVVVYPYSNYNYTPHGYALALAMYNGNRSIGRNGMPHYLNYSRTVRSNSAELQEISQSDCEIYEEVGRTSLDESLETFSLSCEYSLNPQGCYNRVRDQVVNGAVDI